MGYDNYDLNYLNQRGIPLTNTLDVLTFISSFSIGNDVFTHVINTFTDETIVLTGMGM